MEMFSRSLMMLLILASGCSSLNSVQERELKDWQAKNLEVKEKSPGAAAGLNVLPGIGDFYNGNIGFGIVNLLSWPFSILWAPIGGASGANEVNYYATKAHIEVLEAKKKNLKNEIEIAFVGGQIAKNEYYLANKKLDSMSLKDFEKTIEMKDLLPVNIEQLEKSRLPSSIRK